MIGGLWLVPDEMVHEGTWLMGAGLIMLGLNAAHCYTGIKMSRFSIALGIIALAIGLTDFFGLDLPLVPILIILFGASIMGGCSPERTSARPWPAQSGDGLPTGAPQPVSDWG